MRKTPRMAGWFALTLILLACLGAFDWQLAIRTGQKLTNVILFGLTGWALSRAVFAMLTREGRGELEDTPPEVMDAVVQGRALIIAGAMIAGALGL
jgi:hypothetical protein